MTTTTLTAPGMVTTEDRGAARTAPSASVPTTSAMSDYAADVRTAKVMLQLLVLLLIWIALLAPLSIVLVGMFLF